MTFDQWCQRNGLDWHRVGPIHCREWLRAIAHFESAYKAKLLAQVSDIYDSIGAADITRSSLVTAEMSSNWDLKPPTGWTAAQIETWKTLPYTVAALISAKRRDDVKAVRACQNLNAYLKTRDDKSDRTAAILELEKEKNATRPAA